MKNVTVVGAGITGATIARLLAEAGINVTVVEKNNIGGLCRDEKVNGLWRQEFGPHIFHTENEDVWNFVNRFAEFNNYEHKVKLINGQGKKYTLPVNITTVEEVHETTVQSEAGFKMIKDILSINIEPDGFAQNFLFKKFGIAITDTIFRGYSEKFWGKGLWEIPEEIVKRIPFRNNRDDRYFDDKYQGVPKEGFTKMIEKMLNHPKIFIKIRDKFSIESGTCFWTGNLDDIIKEKIPYRCIKFEHIPNSVLTQDTATYNYSDSIDGCHRTSEVERFYEKERDILPKEADLCMEFIDDNGIPCYPMPSCYGAVDKLKDSVPKNIILCGRLGKYRYMNIDKAIEDAMNIVKQYLKDNE